MYVCVFPPSSSGGRGWGMEEGHVRNFHKPHSSGRQRKPLPGAFPKLPALQAEIHPLSRGEGGCLCL